MNRIAFTLPEVGLREVKGLVYIDEGFLVIQVKNVLLGLVDEEKDTIKVEPPALVSVHIKRGLIWDRLVIRPKKMDLLDIVPGDHKNTVELRVLRKYRRDLERLVDEYDAVAREAA
ncbi:MAG: hypothetical protein RhofKO_02690 [Rhodothermales bacterium]